MNNAASSMPLLLANRLIARRSERLGRQFDAILKRMPQAVVFVDDELAQVVVNPAAAELLDLPCFGEVDPVKVAGSMRQLAERSGSRSDLQRLTFEQIFPRLPSITYFH
jgi:PAS domain-containing protein